MTDIQKITASKYSMCLQLCNCFRHFNLAFICKSWVNACGHVTILMKNQHSYCSIILKITRVWRPSQTQQGKAGPLGSSNHLLSRNTNPQLKLGHHLFVNITHRHTFILAVMWTINVLQHGSIEKE